MKIGLDGWNLFGQEPQRIDGVHDRIESGVRLPAFQVGNFSHHEVSHDAGYLHFLIRDYGKSSDLLPSSPTTHGSSSFSSRPSRNLDGFVRIMPVSRS